MTKKTVYVTGKDGTTRAVDVRVKTMHTGRGFQDTSPVYIEPSKEMAPKKQERQLWPDDRKALREINDTLEGFDFKVRAVTANNSLSGTSKKFKFSGAAKGEARILMADYWMLRDAGFAPFQVANHIRQLAFEEINNGGF